MRTVVGCLTGCLLLAACAGPTQGPEVQLVDVARPDPDPLVERARPLPQPTSGPIPADTRVRTWIPRQVTANGDSSDGYWMEISATPPAVETVAPVKPYPHAGPHITHPTAQRPAPATVPGLGTSVAPRTPLGPGLTPEAAALLQQWQRGGTSSVPSALQGGTP